MKSASPVLALMLFSIGMLATETATPPPQGAVTQAPVPPTDPQPARAGGAGRGGRGAARVPFIPDAPVLNYAPVENPLPLPAGMTYATVASVAVNSKGHVFVYHRVPVPLVEFDEKGTFVRAFGQQASNRPHSVRIDAADNIWLVDTADHTVVKLNPQGDLLMTLGTKGVAGSGDAAAAAQQFNIPSDVAIAPNGDIFISQGENGGPDPRVIRFTRDGKFVTTWSLAFKEGTRSNPHAIEVDRQGLVYVADREVMRIRVFQPDGTPVRDIQMQNPVCGLFFDRSGQIWISTGADGQMMHIDPAGKVIGYAGKRGTGLGETSEAHMLAVAPNGDVYVADTVGRKVEKFVRK